MTPATVPVTAAAATGPTRATRPATHPMGATSAPLIAIRCHNGGISPGRCRALATASAAASPTAPANAPETVADRPRSATSAAPAAAPATAANDTDPSRSPESPPRATQRTYRGLRRRSARISTTTAITPLFGVRTEDGIVGARSGRQRTVH